MTDTERRYVQIEKETLSLTWTAEKFSVYLLGKSFLMGTDHKPLVLVGLESFFSLVLLREQKIVPEIVVTSAPVSIF